MDTEEITKLQEEVESIKVRNRRVEADKAWETSWTRRIFVACTTYLVVLILLIAIGNESPFQTAIVPAIAYILSVSSIGILKLWWLKRQ